MSYCVNGFRVDSFHDRAPFLLVVVVALFMVVVFIYFFQKFSSLCVQICGLVSGVRFRYYVYGLGSLRSTKCSGVYCTLAVD